MKLSLHVLQETKLRFHTRSGSVIETDPDYEYTHSIQITLPKGDDVYCVEALDNQGRVKTRLYRWSSNSIKEQSWDDDEPEYYCFSQLVKRVPGRPCNAAPRGGYNY